MDNIHIAFVGAGNMATSLVGGLVARGLPARSLSASDPSVEALRKLEQAFGIRVASDNIDAVRDADVIVLAVKPQVMKPVAQGLAPALSGRKALVISIAAGISLDSLQNWLGRQVPIVRCMPNTPALVGLGATALYANSLVTNEQKQLASDILGAVGISLWLQHEQELDAVTALSGSGPAYYFLLMEAMMASGIRMGLTAATAKQLTLQTALGAATMAMNSEDNPAELRRKVTSPKGTTEQAIASFQRDHFEAMVDRALEAARQRSISLSEELGRS